MKLWTWQNRKLRITDAGMKLDSRTHSTYYNDRAFPNAKEAYEELWEQLGTCQILWCYTEQRYAIKGADHEYRGKVLWELDVPEAGFLTRVCGYAWHWLFAGKGCPGVPEFEHLRPLIEDLYALVGERYSLDRFFEDFNAFWRKLPRKSLWQVLFVDCGIQGCCDILVRHPVEKTWVTKDPNKVGAWWKE
jgi:hypothetical protein